MEQPTTITVPLTPEQNALVHQVVDAGEYSDPVEVVLEAMSEWQLRRELASARLRTLYEEGEASGEAHPLDFDELMEEVKAHVLEHSAR